MATNGVVESDKALAVRIRSHKDTTMRAAFVNGGGTFSFQRTTLSRYMIVVTPDAARLRTAFSAPSPRRFRRAGARSRMTVPASGFGEKAQKG